MTTTIIYKGYIIRTVGISRYIYRPGNQGILSTIASADGYAQSMTAAKNWINEDIRQRLLENNRYYA